MEQILAYKRAKIGPAFNFTAYIYVYVYIYEVESVAIWPEGWHLWVSDARSPRTSTR